MASASGQDLNQTLYEKLKCYICESRLKAGKDHWYKCFANHLVCQDCKEVKGSKKCSCTKNIAPDYCEVIEALLNADKMQFKCENLTRGCQETKEKEDMILHQTECIYRLVKCPSPRTNCGSKVPFHDLLDHMKPDCTSGEREDQYNEFAYTFNSKRSDGEWYDSKKIRWYNPKKITVKNKIFFSTIKIQDGVFYHWIHFYGSPIEAKNYFYTVEYYNDTKTPEVTCSYSDQVVSIDETVDSIIENGNYFSISRRVLENKFFQEKHANEKDNFFFKFSVKIRNLKEEVKDDNVESGVSDVDE